MAELVRQWGSWLDASGWAVLIGLLASIVSILGVPFAVTKAWQARTAAEAARAAAREATEQLSRFGSIANLSTTIEQIEGLKELHRRGSWNLAVTRYSPIRRALIGLREEGVLLTPDQMRDIQAAITLLGRMEQVVDRALAQRETELDLSRLNQQLSLILDRLQSVLYQMQRVTSEGIGGRR